MKRLRNLFARARRVPKTPPDRRPTDDRGQPIVLTSGERRPRVQTLLAVAKARAASSAPVALTDAERAGLARCNELIGIANERILSAIHRREGVPS